MGRDQGGGTQIMAFLIVMVWNVLKIVIELFEHKGDLVISLNVIWCGFVEPVPYTWYQSTVGGATIEQISQFSNCGRIGTSVKNERFTKVLASVLDLLEFFHECTF